MYNMHAYHAKREAKQIDTRHVPVAVTRGLSKKDGPEGAAFAAVAVVVASSPAAGGRSPNKSMINVPVGGIRYGGGILMRKDDYDDGDMVMERGRTQRRRPSCAKFASAGPVQATPVLLRLPAAPEPPCCGGGAVASCVCVCSKEMCLHTFACDKLIIAGLSNIPYPQQQRLIILLPGNTLLISLYTLLYTHHTDRHHTTIAK